MKRKWIAIIAAAAAVLVLAGVLWSSLDGGDEEGVIPGGLIYYKDSSGATEVADIPRNGYHWLERQSDGEDRWVDAGPGNYFTQRYGMPILNPGAPEARIKIQGKEKPERIVITRWPISAWKPGATDVDPAPGEVVDFVYTESRKALTCAVDLVPESLYVVRADYGEEWVEYAFLVSATLEPGGPDPSGQLDGYLETFPAYEYTGETEAVFEDRHFLLSAQPENAAEGLVALAHYQAIAADFDAMGRLYGDTEVMQVNVANSRDNYLEGLYVREYLLTDLETLTEAEALAWDPDLLDFVRADVAAGGLVEYTLVRCGFQMRYSPGLLEAGPQLPEGPYAFYYLCGQTGQDPTWKIYGVYWE